MAKSFGHVLGEKLTMVIVSFPPKFGASRSSLKGEGNQISEIFNSPKSRDIFLPSSVRCI